MCNYYLETDGIYLNNKFDSIKEVIKTKNKNIIDMGTFICIDFENYSFMLNEIFHMDIYVKKEDSHLKERVYSIESDIKSKISGFKFKKEIELFQ